MFTGIVEETGVVQAIEKQGSGCEFWVIAEQILSDLSVGDSVAVNGCCQTVVSLEKQGFIFFSVPETLKVTNLSLLKIGDRVNLERALQLKSRLSGHFVQGHVEATAEVVSIQPSATHLDIAIRYRSPWLIPKGSVTLDGISLTIHQIEGDIFTVQIIPETRRRTNIEDWQVGRQVNIETDFLVKTVDHLLRYYHQLRST